MPRLRPRPPRRRGDLGRDERTGTTSAPSTAESTRPRRQVASRDINTTSRPNPPRVVQLTGVPFPGPWAARGACRDYPPDLFFPPRGGDTLTPTTICGSCPVREPCAAYAAPWPGLQGVWGATTAQDRRMWRRAHPGYRLTRTAIPTFGAA